MVEPGSLRKYAVGAGIALVLGIGYLTMCKKNSEAVNRKTVNGKTVNCEAVNKTVNREAVRSGQSIDTILESVKNDPEAKKEFYGKLLELVKEEAKQNNDYSNEVYRIGMKYTQKPDQETFKDTCGKFYAWAEKVDLMDGLGPKAKARLDKKYREKYVGIIENSFKENYSRTKEYAPQAYDALKKFVQFIIKQVE